MLKVFFSLVFSFAPYELTCVPNHYFPSTVVSILNGLFFFSCLISGLQWQQRNAWEMRTGKFSILVSHSASFCVLMEALNYTVVLPGANESSTCGSQAKSFCFQNYFLNTGLVTPFPMPTYLEYVVFSITLHYVIQITDLLAGR